MVSACKTLRRDVLIEARISFLPIKVITLPCTEAPSKPTARLGGPCMKLRTILIIGMALCGATSAQTPLKVLRFVPQYESTVLDPVTSILQVTHQAALLPYDTLMARDAANEIRPQMVESFKLDAAQNTYSFTLRPGLRFHDGSPVRAADVVASLRRWATRDNAGVWLARLGMRLVAVDDRTFTIATPSPTPMVLLALRGLRPAVHHAREGRDEPSGESRGRDRRFRPVPLRCQRVPVRQPHRLRAQSRLRAPR
jgi:hypothetical protein